MWDPKDRPDPGSTKPAVALFRRGNPAGYLQLEDPEGALSRANQNLEALKAEIAIAGGYDKAYVTPAPAGGIPEEAPGAMLPLVTVPPAAVPTDKVHPGRFKHMQSKHAGGHAPPKARNRKARR